MTSRTTTTTRVYRTAEEGNSAPCWARLSGRRTFQPVLVGTASIETSCSPASCSSGYKRGRLRKPRRWSGLRRRPRRQTGSLFAMLNARFHEQEAYIIAEAGVPGRSPSHQHGGAGTGCKPAATSATWVAAGPPASPTKPKQRQGRRDQGGGRPSARSCSRPGDDRDRPPRAASRPRPHRRAALHRRHERHESRRIDNQLRKTAQRGQSALQFYLSLEDD